MTTFSELMKQMSACTTKEEASALTEREIGEVQTLRPLLLREEARIIVMENLGYLTGYMDRAEAGRLLELFGTRHPLLGAIEDWPKTAEEAIEMGYRYGQRIREEGVSR